MGTVRRLIMGPMSALSEEDTQWFNTWLVDYLGGLRNPDDHKVVTYVLLVLSGMRQLGNSMEWQSAYVKSLLCFMQPEKPRHVRYALRVVQENRTSHFSCNSATS